MEIEVVQIKKDVGNVKLKEKRSRFLFAILLLSESVFNTFLPFFCGAYFFKTQSLLWLIPFLFLLIFNLKIKYTPKNIKFEFIRNL